MRSLLKRSHKNSIWLSTGVNTISEQVVVLRPSDSPWTNGISNTHLCACWAFGSAVPNTAAIDRQGFMQQEASQGKQNWVPAKKPGGKIRRSHSSSKVRWLIQRKWHVNLPYATDYKRHKKNLHTVGGSMSVKYGITKFQFILKTKFPTSS